MSINFGGFGSIYGHEVTHGFFTEESGSVLKPHDRSGYKKIWSDETFEIFINESICLIDQYSQFYDGSYHLDSKSTLGMGYINFKINKASKNKFK